MHLSGILFAGFGSAIMYFAWKSDAARKTLNWQITVLIMNAGSALFIHVGIGMILIWTMNIVNIICSAYAAYNAFCNKPYDYPFAIPLFKTDK
jgi:uncharacterized Tic20 family protein